MIKGGSITKLRIGSWPRTNKLRQKQIPASPRVFSSRVIFLKFSWNNTWAKCLGYRDAIIVTHASFARSSYQRKRDRHRRRPGGPRSPPASRPRKNACRHSPANAPNTFGTNRSAFAPARAASALAQGRSEPPFAAAQRDCPYHGIGSSHSDLSPAMLRCWSVLDSLLLMHRTSVKSGIGSARTLRTVKNVALRCGWNLSTT